MPDTALQAVRWLLLVSGIANVLQSTLLFEWVQRTFMARFALYGERVGRPVPSWFLDRRLHRAWGFLMAAVFFGLWWLLGTPGGASWFAANWR